MLNFSARRPYLIALLISVALALWLLSGQRGVTRSKASTGTFKIIN